MYLKSSFGLRELGEDFPSNFLKIKVLLSGTVICGTKKRFIYFFFENFKPFLRRVHVPLTLKFFFSSISVVLKQKCNTKLERCGVQRTA